ncbi:class A beta-lactamase [Sphaerisporangium album]|uniref:Beta-lactamase n=1 Tax=Sphaerisporangium album TaxID=509200 RepID=A0A367FST0_9ACTN|nr:class A beta-lactamase [Sphaerisporangium album]RCG32750.1 class A beta-lactamase [Sphaerisporangium album]
MRHLPTHRLPAALKATGLTISLLAGGTACGVDTAVADSRAIPRTGVALTATGVKQGGLEDLRLTSPREAVAHRLLRDLEKSSKGRIGAYAVDTATGRTIGYRSGERFPLLSTFKALACAAVLDKARTSTPGLMNRVIHWKSGDLKENSPVTEKHVDDGMTVAKLCEAAITYSDNTAANMVLRQIGGPAGLTKYFRSLKDPITHLDRWETELNNWSLKEKRDTTTPAAIAHDLRKVTVDNALDPRDRAQLNAWLRANTTGDARIRAALPKTWIIGDKTGSSSSYGSANDIAVIHPTATTPPIIMTIYTNHHARDTAYDNKLIADTAAILTKSLGKLP